MEKKTKKLLKNQIFKTVLVLIFVIALPGMDFFLFPLILPHKVMAVEDIIYFDTDNVTVNENEGEIVLVIWRIRYSLFLINANYSTSDVTAVSGNDYTESSGTINMNVFLSTTLTIPILNDAVGEDNETFVITLSGQYTLNDPANGYYNSCTVTIIDDDETPSSDNNNLVSLEISEGNLSPDFDSVIEGYTVNTTFGIDSMYIRAAVEDSSASITIEGVPVISGEWYGPVMLSAGTNTVEIDVEAENEDVKTYVLTINRDILPVVTEGDMTISSIGSNLISVGNSIPFQGEQQVIAIDDTTTGWGWSVTIFFSKYIVCEAGEVDDPCIPGIGNGIEIEIPILRWLDSVVIDKIEYPGGIIDDEDIVLNLVDIVNGDEYYELEMFTEENGGQGGYIFDVKFTLEAGSWLPEGSVVTAGGNGSRFDDDIYNVLENSVTITAGDKIQVFAASYKINIHYEIERNSES